MIHNDLLAVVDRLRGLATRTPPATFSDFRPVINNLESLAVQVEALETQAPLQMEFTESVDLSFSVNLYTAETAAEEV